MSKYDEFWDLIRNELEAAIQKSLQTRSEATLKLSGLTGQGKRATWYAKGVIGSHNPDNMAHGTALANCLTAYARNKQLAIDYTVAGDGSSVQFTARHTESLPQVTPPRFRPAQITYPPVKEKQSILHIPMTTKTPSAQSPNPQSQVASSVKNLEGKTLIILPCCGDKKGKWTSGPYPAVPNAFTQACKLITKPRPCVPRLPGSEAPTPALWLYNGFLYKPLDKFTLHTAMNDWLDIVIISGGYGMTHAYEPIVPYEAKMPIFFNHWIEAGLPNALNAYIKNTKPNNVIAFFTNNTNNPQSRPEESYGGMFMRGVAETNVRGILGKYVAHVMADSTTGNTKLGELVMEVVRTRTLIKRDDIPFRDANWFNRNKNKARA